MILVIPHFRDQGRGGTQYFVLILMMQVLQNQQKLAKFLRKETCIYIVSK